MKIQSKRKATGEPDISIGTGSNEVPMVPMEVPAPGVHGGLVMASVDIVASVPPGDGNRSRINAERRAEVIATAKCGQPSVPPDPAIVAGVLADIEGGANLRKACANNGISHFLWYQWCRVQSFSDNYTRARELRADAVVEDALEIADDSRNDTQIDEETGFPVVNQDNIQRARLRVDIRKWYASKLRPKQYGERTTIAGDPDAPLMPVAAPLDFDKAIDECRTVLAKFALPMPK